MQSGERSLYGGEVIRTAAGIYPQLHLTPGEEGEKAYKAIVTQGEAAPTDSLAHFRGSEKDSWVWEKTPAGTVPVITLGERADFELFLQIMAHRCAPVEIPGTQGAAILDGVINWTKIRAHKEEFFRAGGPDADWAEEFARFTADSANFKDALIVLSWGPYSALSAEDADLPEKEWLAASHTIRKAHECTHFICRRLFPDKKDAVWDEMVADAAGLYAAFGRYDAALAGRFLGVSRNGYTGGRLENYVHEKEARRQLDDLAGRVWKVLLRFEKIAAASPEIGAYDLALRLEEEMPCWKQT